MSRLRLFYMRGKVDFINLKSKNGVSPENAATISTEAFIIQNKH